MKWQSTFTPKGKWEKFENLKMRQFEDWRMCNLRIRQWADKFWEFDFRKELRVRKEVTSRSAYRDYHFKKADRSAVTTCSSIGHNVLNRCVFRIDSIEGLKGWRPEMWWKGRRPTTAGPKEVTSNRWRSYRSVHRCSLLNFNFTVKLCGNIVQLCAAKESGVDRHNVNRFGRTFTN